jgi:hypothetical protein
MSNLCPDPLETGRWNACLSQSGVKRDPDDISLLENKLKTLWPFVLEEAARDRDSIRDWHSDCFSFAEASVKIAELARAIEASLIVASGKGDPEITRVYGAQAMSDLIANAAADTLLVTSLNNSQLIRVAELMDAPGICLVDANEPAVDLIERARLAGTALLLSRADFASTCARAAACISPGEAGLG